MIFPRHSLETVAQKEVNVRIRSRLGWTMEWQQRGQGKFGVGVAMKEAGTRSHCCMSLLKVFKINLYFYYCSYHHRQNASHPIIHSLSKISLSTSVTSFWGYIKEYIWGRLRHSLCLWKWVHWEIQWGQVSAASCPRAALVKLSGVSLHFLKDSIILAA